MINNINIAHQSTNPQYDGLQFGVGFPVEWGFCSSDGQGGPPPDDAGTLHVTVATAEDELYEEGITISFTLQSLVDDLIEGTSSNGVVTGDHALDVSRLIQRLRDAANTLERSLTAKAA